MYYGAATGIDASSETKLTASDGASYDDFAFGLAGAGDLDGDGYSDLVVGASGDDDAGNSAGALYVYFGSASGVLASSELKRTASDAAASDFLGFFVSGAGDVDGDGYDDVVVGARGDDDQGALSGSAYVYYGSATGLQATAEDKLTASDGAASDYFGTAVRGAGDLDGDGYDDVVVGAPYDDDLGSSSGALYVYYGSATGIRSSSETKLTASDGAAGDELGYPIGRLGDLDGDGYDDLVVGAHYDDDDGTSSGSAYVYFGSSSGLRVDSERKLTAPDAEAGAEFGLWVGGTGDVDGDGLPDLVVGAPYHDLDGTDVGAVYVYAGGCRDDDGDGFCTADDCNDSDATIHPDATEVAADGVDGNCDGVELCYADADADGFTSGTVTSADLDCTASGEASSASAQADCDDTDATAFPGATEGVGDEVDADCDGGEVCYTDADDDGFIDGTTTVVSADTDCADSGEGLATDPTGDCDDTDATIFPGATEGVGDSVDQDCDGAETCYADVDDDGFIDGTTTVVSADTDCADSGEGLATDAAGDCDDTDATIFPGATEAVGDGVDSDCNGQEVCFVDRDGDGAVDPTGTVAASDTASDTACTGRGEGPATADIDCDDTDATIFPGATEAVGDGVDQDCDGAETCFLDADEARGEA